MAKNLIFKNNFQQHSPPASKGSREVANLTTRKNMQAHVYGVREIVCLSVMFYAVAKHTQATFT